MMGKSNTWTERREKGDKNVNEQILKGKWRRIKGDIRQDWGKLTNNDLDRVEGTINKLFGLLQEKYGYAKEKAKEEFSHFVDESKRHVRR